MLDREAEAEVESWSEDGTVREPRGSRGCHPGRPLEPCRVAWCPQSCATLG